MSSSKDQRRKQYAQYFWDKIETELRILIPIHIRNIFNCTGYANHVSIRTITELNKIADFVKSPAYLKVVPQDGSKDDYYGSAYSSNPTKFEFTPEEEKLIFGIVKFTKENPDVF